MTKLNFLYCNFANKTYVERQSIRGFGGRGIHVLLTLLAATLLFFAVPLQVTAQEDGNQTTQSTSTVNINTADAKKLARVLKGVGTKRARKIVEWREINGDFGSIEQLTEVKGITEKTLELNLGRILLE